MSEHALDRSLIHHEWNNALEPALSIRSGDVIDFDLLMCGTGQVFDDSSIEDVVWDFDTMYNLAGPIHVEGARPGDTLRIEILSLVPGPWGWTTIMPGLGLLPDDFPEAHLQIWDLRNGEFAMLGDSVRVPLRNFLGTLGVALDEPGSITPFPPNRGGGNIDTRHLIVGSTLWLPVWCEGALFSCGDPHAAQGDGEVCVAAIECDMQATLRFTLQKRTIPAPQFRVPGSLTPRTDTGGYHGTMGIDPDLMQGAKLAVRVMIDWIEADRGLSREDAYVLCSLAGDLKILEIVDAGVWNVGFTLPLDVFTNR
jgi:acetamidase/formamidase